MSYPKLPRYDQVADVIYNEQPRDRETDGALENPRLRAVDSEREDERQRDGEEDYRQVSDAEGWKTCCGSSIGEQVKLQIPSTNT